MFLSMIENTVAIATLYVSIDSLGSPNCSMVQELLSQLAKVLLSNIANMVRA
jgi:hypothetical protein